MPTDDAVISVYGSLDGSAWSATPLVVLVLDKDVDPNSIDFIVTGVYQFQVGLKRSGFTDTITSADLACRKDGVSVDRCCCASRRWNVQPRLVARPWREHRSASSGPEISPRCSVRHSRSGAGPCAVVLRAARPDRTALAAPPSTPPHQDMWQRITPRTQP
jgi:hypothetical protein